MPKTNEVTLFSSGIGHFRRVYKITQANQSISIPFNKEHIGDVASSLHVFGGVKLVCPPMFTPANSQATALRINSQNAIGSLLTSLSGAAIRVKGGYGGDWLTGTLLGMNKVAQVTPTGFVEKEFISVLTSEGVRQFQLDGLYAIDFPDETVKAEIAKAMKANFNQIKPDSVFLDLTLSPTKEGEDTEIEIQYAIPVAAWKMRYSIREVGKKYTFEGAAVVDNNTDEDWNNFIVSVVTGNPTSFSTDIAQIVVPQRKFVRLVDGQALGNVDVREYTSAMGFESAPAGGRGIAKSARAMAYSNTMARSAVMAACAAPQAEYCAEVLEEEDAMADANVETKEIGDFCVFTHREPVTIQAKKSAVVPMFSVVLDLAGTVLFYKQENHPRRPFRAIKFTNTTDLSLGKGKTVVYKDGVLAGEAVLDATKPGDNRMLPHCLENGVRIVAEHKDIEQRHSAIKISKGVGIEEIVYTGATEYAIDNRKDEDFQVIIEHQNRLHGNSLEVRCSGTVKVDKTDKITDGRMIAFNVAAKESVVLLVTETLLEVQQTKLRGFDWVKSVIVRRDNPLAKDEHVKACAEIQEKIDNIDSELSDLASETQRLQAQANRVQGYLKSTGDKVEGSVIQEWVMDLNVTEKRVREIEDTKIPALKADRKNLEDSLRAALKKLSVEWQQKPQEDWVEAK